MTTTLENVPLSVGLSVAKLRSVIASLAENIEGLQTRQIENDEKFKEFQKEIELSHAKEPSQNAIESADVTSSKVDTSAITLENAKLRKDLEEAVHIIESKTQSIESLNKKVLLVESDLAQKDKELSQKNSQLKNVDMMISVFQKNMALVRSQFSEVQERFHKEQSSVDKLKKTHENMVRAQKAYQEDIGKLTLESKMKQLKINTQEEKIVEMYSNLREQTALLEETKLKLKSISFIPFYYYTLLLPIFLN
jgi:chromosome segregation ATPase